uniref:M-lycotoxin-Ls3a n=2 Tax=Lycosidae TaxID=74973 RepID=LYC1_LYCSI|nr:RecName: Full=M-lycotoxin-Ls3a; Short=M-LCTX-Ls3a; AltName: Full=Lycocitin-1 [Lycosa singoriensis]
GKLQAFLAKMKEIAAQTL